MKKTKFITTLSAVTTESEAQCLAGYIPEDQFEGEPEPPKWTVGMKVWDDVVCPGIEGEVERVDGGDDYPIVARFGTPRGYTKDGAYFERMTPTLSQFPYRFEIKPVEEKPKPFEFVCQDGICNDPEQRVFMVSWNQNTPFVNSNYAKYCTEWPVGSVFFLVKSTCQQYLDSLLVGYKCPKDLFGGLVARGTVYEKDDCCHTYRPINRKDKLYRVPAEVVETWKPVYKKPTTDQNQ